MAAAGEKEEQGDENAAVLRSLVGYARERK
jgi:hypothetical protein